METPITKESLLIYGMKPDHTGFFTLSKTIADANGDLDKMAIAVDHSRNVAQLCLALPDGSTLYLNVKSIEELQAFENCIQSYEPNF